METKTETPDYYDISPVIHEGIAVFPGDTAFSRNVLMSIDDGSHIDLSTIKSTVHLGAHADAPSHYHKDGKGIDERDLMLYMGLCQVISVNIPKKERIQREHVTTAINAPRVLFKTESFPNPDQWVDDFNSLGPELIDWLTELGVRLVGIDTPSVDPSDSKDLPSHQSLYKNDMAVLEGVDLRLVPDGLYNLVALPLRLKDADASPVRAILLRLGDNS
ncbi:MAG: cyclase family protein [Bacteriovoracaceae bacterium]|nr:cyclase family protein [Bacteriovoracaceae bacterium]